MRNAELRKLSIFSLTIRRILNIANPNFPPPPPDYKPNRFVMHFFSFLRTSSSECEPQGLVSEFYRFVTTFASVH